MRDVKRFLHDFGGIGQEDEPAWGMAPEALFPELLGLGLSWERAASRFEPASGAVFLGIRERPSFWESVRGPQDGRRAFCDDHTKGLNSVFSTAKSKARGYRSIVNRIAILYLVADKPRLLHT